jgi:hypothetical protein
MPIAKRIQQDQTNQLIKKQQLQQEAPVSAQFDVSTVGPTVGVVEPVATVASQRYQQCQHETELKEGLFVDQRQEPLEQLHAFQQPDDETAACEWTRTEQGCAQQVLEQKLKELRQKLEDQKRQQEEAATVAKARRIEHEQQILKQKQEHERKLKELQQHQEEAIATITAARPEPNAGAAYLKEASNAQSLPKETTTLQLGNPPGNTIEKHSEVGLIVSVEDYISRLKRKHSSLHTIILPKADKTRTKKRRLAVTLMKK